MKDPMPEVKPQNLDDAIILALSIGPLNSIHDRLYNVLSEFITREVASAKKYATSDAEAENLEVLLLKLIRRKVPFRF